VPHFNDRFTVELTVLARRISGPDA